MVQQPTEGQGLPATCWPIHLSAERDQRSSQFMCDMWSEHHIPSHFSSLHWDYSGYQNLSYTETWDKRPDRNWCHRHSNEKFSWLQHMDQCPWGHEP